mgnify:CR=1 FL=1
MAIHDTETMNAVAAELKKINPSIFVYGEGWTVNTGLLPFRRSRAFFCKSKKFPLVRYPR